MKRLIPRKGRLAYRHDDEEPLERPRVCALVAVNGPRHDPAVDAKLSATTDAGARDAAGNAEVESLASTRAVEGSSHRIEAIQPRGASRFVSDPAFVVPVIASPQEIRHARELREQLKKKYLNLPNQPCSPWCTGVD
jgi:hypothetical protein